MGDHISRPPLGGSGTRQVVCSALAKVAVHHPLSDEPHGAAMASHAIVERKLVQVERLLFVLDTVESACKKREKRNGGRKEGGRVTQESDL